MSAASIIREKIRTIPDFPKPGILFRDITTLLRDAEGFQLVIQEFERRLAGKPVDLVAGIESRGFILAGALAAALGKGFIPIRKPGKLPGRTIAETYQLEYGTDTLHVHSDAVEPGANVVLVDDLVATGGTMLAACRLLERLGGRITDLLFIVDLPDLGGRRQIEAKNYPTFWITDFAGH